MNNSYSSSVVSDDLDEYPKVTQADLDRATFRVGLKPTPRKQRATMLLDPMDEEQLRLSGDKMNQIISHDWADESPEAKARWFQSLTMEERMDILCWFTDLILAANPRIVEQKRVEPVAGRVLVLTQTQGRLLELKLD
jgi:hypothetical protein